MKKTNFNKIRASILLDIRIIFTAILLAFLLSYKKLPRLLEMVESKKSNVRLNEVEIQNMIEKINRIARFKFFLIRNNCLKKNLLFYYFLIQSGVKNVRIHIGISKVETKLDGHCWLTLDDQIFLDSEESISKYTVIYTSGV